jgi:hypothetical protein
MSFSPLELIISVLSILMLILMGNKSKWGPLVGLCGQVFWVWFVIDSQRWGLMPGVLAFTIVQIRNSILWWS